MMFSMKTTSETKCGECGGFGCEVRAARGFKRFCEMAAPVTKDDGLFSCYAEAVKASPIGKARWVSGGLYTGGPAKFKALQAGETK
jgi:hypothetical protein